MVLTSMFELEDLIPYRGEIKSKNSEVRAPREETRFLISLKV